MFPRIGVMINSLGGNEETVKAFKASIGKEIEDLILGEKELQLHFTDDSSLSIFDGGQSCCESRYMRTDDILTDHTGGILQNIVLKDAHNVGDDEYGGHEVQFLEIQTSKGILTISNHNEHNGYYGGFAIVLRYNDPAQKGEHDGEGTE
jgi:hypothetical protein